MVTLDRRLAATGGCIFKNWTIPLFQSILKLVYSSLSIVKIHDKLVLWNGSIKPQIILTLECFNGRTKLLIFNWSNHRLSFFSIVFIFWHHHHPPPPLRHNLSDICRLLLWLQENSTFLPGQQFPCITEIFCSQK